MNSGTGAGGGWAGGQAAAGAAVARMALAASKLGVGEGMAVLPALPGVAVAAAGALVGVGVGPWVTVGASEAVGATVGGAAVGLGAPPRLQASSARTSTVRDRRRRRLGMEGDYSRGWAGGQRG